MESNKSVILIGATGHIGSWVHRSLTEKGFNVTACSRKKMALPEKMEAHTTWVNIDLSDVNSIKKAFESRPHESFIHLASEKVIGKAEEDPEKAIEVNVCGTAHVLAAAAASGIKNGIFASSWAVYAPTDHVGQAHMENDPLAPPTVYGLTKKVGEELCGSYAKSGRIPNLLILRLFNTVGGPAYDGAAEQAGFFHYVAKAADKNMPITLAGTDFPTEDGTCVRDFLDVRDVADLVADLAPQEKSGIFNIGSGSAVSLESVIRAFEKISDKKIERRVVERRPSDPAYVCADISKAQKELNFIPMHTLEDKVNSSFNL